MISENEAALRKNRKKRLKKRAVCTCAIDSIYLTVI